jgi:hypothetical protein
MSHRTNTLRLARGEPARPFTGTALDVTLRACDRNVPDPVYRLAEGVSPTNIALTRVWIRRDRGASLRRARQGHTGQPRSHAHASGGAAGAALGACCGAGRRNGT